MKKLLCGLFILISYTSFAQETIKEPEFAGEVFILQPDGTHVKLEKENAKIKSKSGLSLIVTGYGTVKVKLNIKGCCSNSNISSEGELKMIVRAIDNNMDPLDIIQVFKLEQKKSKRSAELASYGSFNGSSENNLDNLAFNAEKYGENSYLLTINNFERNREYGIIVKNNNMPIQATTFVSTFAIN